MAEAELLINAGNLQDALTLLAVVQDTLPAAQRSAYLELYYSAAQEFCGNVDAAVSVPFVRDALALLHEGEVHGAPLHFVLGVYDRAAAASGAAPEGVQARQQAQALEQQFLTRQIESFFAGTDPSIPNLVATITRLGTAQGFELALPALDAVLRRDPSLIPLWRLRARWLVDLDATDEATRSLLWLPRYLHSPATLDQLIQLMARSGTLVENGEALLADSGLISASRFSLGLVQLRLGTYQPAEQAIEKAPAQPDGAHLYFRAMALLALHNQKASDLAHNLLVQLVADYPISTYRESAVMVAALL
jgi:tetratricopeptide (TPR) repeat protein